MADAPTHSLEEQHTGAGRAIANYQRGPLPELPSARPACAVCAENAGHIRCYNIALGGLSPLTHLNTPRAYCGLIGFFTESGRCADYPLGFNSVARSLSSRTDECGLAIDIHVKSALMHVLFKFYKTHVSFARLRDGRVPAAPPAGGLIRAKLPAVPRCSNRLPTTKNKNTGNSTTPKPYASRGSN